MCSSQGFLIDAESPFVKKYRQMIKRNKELDFVLICTLLKSLLNGQLSAI